MNQNKFEVKNRYFEWLYNYMCKEKICEGISYKEIFMLLYETDFDFYIYDDMNRAIDGIDLRNRFAIENGDIHISDYLDDSCNVLEMMVALAIRCEETIMDNPKYGDRTAQWFWCMMSNLGLSYMNDKNYDKKIANNIIYNFLERQYKPNGKGGLFYIRNCEEDLRNVSIWTQLCWYLDNFD